MSQIGIGSTGCHSHSLVSTVVIPALPLWHGHLATASHRGDLPVHHGLEGRATSDDRLGAAVKRWPKAVSIASRPSSSAARKGDRSARFSLAIGGRSSLVSGLMTR